MEREPYWYLFNVHDPDFKVESLQDYYILMQRLGEITTDVAMDYPDKRCLVFWGTHEG